MSSSEDRVLVGVVEEVGSDCSRLRQGALAEHIERE
jgi:hypothetical protein